MRLSDISVSVTPLVCEIGDDDYQVRVETQVAATIAVSVAAPYVILRWTYTGTTGNYMDILAVSEVNIQANDLIVGKCVFAGAVLTGFDYNTGNVDAATFSPRRSVPHTLAERFKVEPTATPSMAVNVRGGVISNGTYIWMIPDQTTGALVAPASSTRYDIICLVGSTVTVVTGIEGSGTYPDPAGRIVLAVLKMVVGQTSILKTDIFDARPSYVDFTTQFVAMVGNQVVAGIKTFSSSPIVPTPTTDYQVSTKKYVDDLAALDVHLTGDQTIGGIKTFSVSPIVPTPTTSYQVSTKKYVDDVVAAIVILPSQTGNAGKSLVTNGSTASWDSPTYAA